MTGVLTPPGSTPCDDERSDVLELRFAAMGTRVQVLVVDGTAADLELAQEAIDDLERRWSRFRSDSEISALNHANGHPVAVSHETWVLVQRACQAWHLSDGAFDPTVLTALVERGYDRSFETLGEADRHRPTGITARAPGCSGVDLDDRARTVRLPPGFGFDPGGIGKGLAADMVAARLMRRGVTGCLVSIGGDLVARGSHPDGAWTVAIDEPTLGFEGPIATVSFHDGALATSTTTRRRWSCDGDVQHHLIDPATGRCHDRDIVLVTAVACEGWLAEATTKAALATPTAPALASVPRLVLEADGTLEAHAGMEHYLGPVTPDAPAHHGEQVS